MWDLFYNFIYYELINATVPTAITTNLANLLTVVSMVLLYWVLLKLVIIVFSWSKIIWWR